ncbi:MAG: phage holin family protein [Peptococcaceae bacterium]
MDEKAVILFECLHNASDTLEGKAMYVLTMVCVLMIVDFITGTAAAWLNTEIKFNSQAGINGILRKVVSIIALAVCIPIAAMLPDDLGLYTLLALYIGYMLMEFTSIVENLGKMGVPITPLQTFIQNVKEELKEDDRK